MLLSIKSWHFNNHKLDFFVSKNVKLNYFTYAYFFVDYYLTRYIID